MSKRTTIKYTGGWREPAAQTNGFPKLMVHDDVVTGSINIRNTRLPLWSIVPHAILEGWDVVERGWEPEKHYGYTKEDMAHFLYCLLEQRGEFGRLLLLLAKAEDSEKTFAVWWENAYYRQRVIDQLEACLAILRNLAYKGYSEKGEQ
jgi:hypothetical protein